jgi:hypothetical protein
MRLSVRCALPVCVLLTAMSCGGSDGTPTGSDGGIPGAGGSHAGGSHAGGSHAGGSHAGGSHAGGSGSSTGQSGGASSGGSELGGAMSGGMGGEGSTDDSGGTSGSSGGSGGSSEGRGGSNGAGTPDICTFDIVGAISPDMPTVGVVEWSTDLAGVTEATVEFSLKDPQPGELNVGSGGPISASDPEALLLGLKQERDYTYRITAIAGNTVCVSPDQLITTGVLPSSPAVVREEGPAASSQEIGFIINGGYGTKPLIIDADGDVVWTFPFSGQCTRAHMSWDGEHMWMMKGNASTGTTAGGSDGSVWRVRMDGSDEEDLTAGLERSHHDFAVLPDGWATFLVVVEEGEAAGDTALVERAPDGTLTEIVVLNEDSYLTGGTATHPNALRYIARDDSYTVSDLDVSSIINFDRLGTAVWQVNGSYCAEPLLENCESLNLTGTHGHQWLENGNLLVFLAGIGTGGLGAPNSVVEYSFDGRMISSNASLEWHYLESHGSLILGDAQRLPNGNTLITYSDDGMIYEVNEAKELVQSLDVNGRYGYGSFRRTLYGPPQ